MSGESSLYAIAVLIDELKAEDVTKRVTALKNLHKIAQALGHERTRLELIPYLSELMDDDDQVLIQMAETLSDFMPYIGGKSYAFLLLDPLEQLCHVEESAVRNSSISSIKKIFKAAPEIVPNQGCQLILKLSNEELFSSKITASNLISTAFNVINATKQNELLEALITLSKDGNSQVRRAVAVSLSELVIYLNQSNQSLLIKILENLCIDEQDSVRLLAAETALEMGKKLANSSNFNLVSLINQLLEDKSWRVRYVIANKICDLSTTNLNQIILPTFVRFMQDADVEIRTSIGQNLAKFCKLISVNDIVTQIVPLLQPLAKDQQTIRAALAENLCEVAVIVGKQHANDLILPIILPLLRDESADIRFCVFSNLGKLDQVIGLKNLEQSILSAVSEMAEDKNWRVRLQLIEIFPQIAKQLGKEFFEEKLCQFYLEWLEDSIYSIRQAAIKVLKQLYEILGMSFFKLKIMPKLLALQNFTNYLYRLTILYVVMELVDSLPQECLKQEILPLVNQLSQDTVPNIRMNSSKCLGMMAKRINTPEIKQQLIKLTQDEDIDVRHFSQLALESQQSFQTQYKPITPFPFFTYLNINPIIPIYLIPLFYMVAIKDQALFTLT